MGTLLRSDLQDTFSMLQKLEIPFIVVSAGFTQVIETIVKKQVPCFPKPLTRLVANDMCVPETRVASGHKATALDLVSDFTNLSENRHKVLLLGDKPSDCDVAKGLPAECTVLKIGFMKHRDPLPADLEKQLQHFDVVLTGDPSMSFINQLLSDISSTAG